MGEFYGKETENCKINALYFLFGRRVLPVALLILGPVLLGGCTATVDRFSARSARYNIETADSKSLSILTNILRASDGLPLQFTDISTVTGQGSIEGSVGASLPIAVSPDTVEQTYSISPTITGSGGSNFNVVNLNTQEFYRGLQTPVDIKHIANFITAGYDPQLVLFLTISHIDVRTQGTRLTIDSTASNLSKYRSFYQAVDLLRQAGLSTRDGDPSPVGPELSAQDLRDPRIVATMIGTERKLSLRETTKGSSRYHLYKGGGYEFCFDPIKQALDPIPGLPKGPATTPFGENAELRVLGTMPSHIEATLAVADGKKVPAASFNVGPQYYCDPPEGANPAAYPDKILVSTRSVQGIFQFLGEIARLQLRSAKDADATTEDFAVMDGNATWRKIWPFRIVFGRPADAAMTISYEGEAYSILKDRSGATDQSTRVVQLLTDLLALQSSAKDLPAPNLISITGR